MDQIAYVNGSFVPLSEAKVSVLDRGFLFADGIYEVAAVLDGKLIDNASHLARLQRSVGEIALALPETLERIQEIQRELIERNNLVNGMVYLEVTRGAGKEPGQIARISSLRGAQRRSNPSFLCGAMDCFASLAMTGWQPRPNAKVSSTGIFARGRCGDCRRNRSSARPRRFRPGP